MAATTLTRMSNKKPRPDRHKPRRMVGLPVRVCLALEELGKEKEATLAEMAKHACIFFLEHHHRWPPPSGKTPPKS